MLGVIFKVSLKIVLMSNSERSKDRNIWKLKKINKFLRSFNKDFLENLLVKSNYYGVIDLCMRFLKNNDKSRFYTRNLCNRILKIL